MREPPRRSRTRSRRSPIFRVNRKDAAGGEGVTQFGRALLALSIDIICANSPQAKGRIERAFGTLQDRMVKELRLAGISSIAAANAWLPAFITAYNTRFGRDPANAKNLHRPLGRSDDLDEILDARRIGEYYPGLSPNSPECMDRLGLSLAHLESKCTNIYDAAEAERVYYPEIERLLLDFFPDATDALVYNHDVFDKDYTGDRTEDQDGNNPGVNANYASLVHNDLNDNSGRVRCRELLTRNLRNFGRTQHYTGEEADAKMSRRFMSINLAKPIETVEQFPFVLCA
jgi:hypothetical protein